jgi:hypothetical protein
VDINASRLIDSWMAQAGSNCSVVLIAGYRDERFPRGDGAAINLSEGVIEVIQRRPQLQIRQHLADMGRVARTARQR